LPSKLKRRLDSAKKRKGSENKMRSPTKKRRVPNKKAGDPSRNREPRLLKSQNKQVTRQSPRIRQVVRIPMER
jgi:uncharacterized protein with WD repeat